MKVILQKTVSKLGQPGTIKEVKSGYARNFLIPRRLAVRATPENLSQWEARKRHVEQQQTQKIEAAKETAKKLDGLVLNLLAEAGEEGKLYGAVTKNKVLKELAAKGVILDRTALTMSAPIKSLGTHTLAVKLHPEVAAKVTLEIARS